MGKLSGTDVASAGLTDWSLLQAGLHTRLLTKDFATGLRLVNAIGDAAEAADHHPDLDLRYAYVDVRLVSHDVQAVTDRDVRLARTISDLAAAAGVLAAPRLAVQLEVGLDTPDADAIRPFWAAVLDMAETSGELRGSSLPNLWFQTSGREEPRQRFHFDVWVPPEVVEQRIAAAVAAGGVLVSDAEAPAFWVLADAEDNRVCLCTWQSRE